MTKFHYRLEIGNKCVYLDDVSKAITLKNESYTPMDFEMAKKVINEIGKDVIKVYRVERTYVESEREISINNF